MNQNLIEVVLRKMGHEPYLAPDGEVALQLALSHRFDLVLMDIQMPKYVIVTLRAIEHTIVMFWCQALRMKNTPHIYIYVLIETEDRLPHITYMKIPKTYTNKMECDTNTYTSFNF